jgi:regulator of replication initiation timing
MPDTATAEAPAQETITTPAEASTFDSMAKHFEATQKAMLGDNAPTLSNEVHEQQQQPAKVAPVVEKPVTEATPTVDEIISEKPEAVVQTPAEAELPKGASPKSHEAFALVKTQREALRAEVGKLTAEVETLRKAPKEDGALKGEVETLRKRLADAEAIVERSAFEHSPKFKEFAAREQQQMKLAETYLEGSDTKPEVLQAAAVARGQQRLKILRDAGMDAEMIAAVVPHLSAIDTLQAQKSEALAKQGELSAQWDAEQKQAAQQREAYERHEDERAFDDRMEWAEKTMAPFQKVEGNEKWNAQVDRLKADAREFALGSMPREKLFELGMAGLAYKVEAARSARLADLLKAEREKNAALSTAQPDAGITNGARPQNGTGLSLDQQRAAAFVAAGGQG